MATLALSSLIHSTSNINKPSNVYIPEAHTLYFLHKCTSIREAKQIHAYSIKAHLQGNIFFIKHLIKFCTLHPTSGSLNHARLLFDQIPNPDILLFNIMACAYAQSEIPLQSFHLFTEILSLGLVPDNYTFPSLFKACANAFALQQGKQLHCLAMKHGLDMDEFSCPALMSMYIKGGDINSARFVFERTKKPCVITYNAMIMGYLTSSKPYEALSLFHELQNKGLKPTDVTILGIISSCALLGALELGKWIHEYVKKNKFDHYVKVNTALIDMYAKCGSLEDAVHVFESMNFKDKQAWSTMIMAYAIHGHGYEAISMFEEMSKAGVQPDSITFLGVLSACNHAGLTENCISFLSNMTKKYKIVPDIKHYGCVLDSLARVGRLDDAYKFIKNLPLKPTPLIWRTLLSACNVHGNIEMGKKVMKKILELDQSHSGDYVIFSNMCSRGGRYEDARKMRVLMKERGLTKLPGCSSIQVNNVVHEFFSGNDIRAEYKELNQTLDKIIEQLKLNGYVLDTCLVYHEDMNDEEKEVSLKYHSEKLAIAFGILKSPPGKTIRVVKNLRICKDCHNFAKHLSFVYNLLIVVRDMQRFHRFKQGKCSCGDFW